MKGERPAVGADDGEVPSTERRIEVPRTARYHVLGDPAAGQIWYALHGYAQLAGPFAGVFAEIAGGRLHVVAPEGLSRFYPEESLRQHGPGDPVGASWMTREARGLEIGDYVRYLDLLAAAVEDEPEGGGGARPTDARVVLGFSQGVHTAARWIAFGERSPERLIAWGAPLPNDLPLERFAHAIGAHPVVIVHGASDAAFGPEAARAEGDRLADAGIAVVHRSHGGGHRLSRSLLRELADGTAGEPEGTGPAGPESGRGSGAQNSPTKEISGTNS